MREVMEALNGAFSDGRRVAMATVVRTEGSAPRAVGTSMLVTGEGSPIGSVSGGCIEASVIEQAATVLATGVPELLHFGMSDDDGFSIGLTCGGSVDIFVQAFERATCPHFASLQKALEQNSPCAMVTIFEERLDCWVATGWSIRVLPSHSCLPVQAWRGMLFRPQTAPFRRP